MSQEKLEQEELTQEQLDQLVSLMMRGESMAKLIGMDPDALEGLYALAHNLYGSGNYKDAETVFRALCLYDTNDWRFWFGLGGCRQALDQLQPAFEAYQMASVATAMKNPEPLFYAVKCLLKMGRREDAIAGLQGILSMSDRSVPEYAAVLKRAEATLELLREGDAQ